MKRMKSSTVVGGKNLERFLAKAGYGGVAGVKVGFIGSAKYKDGASVVQVAAANEFGTGHIPERPFFRNAVKVMSPLVRRVLVKRVDPKLMVVTESLAGQVGLKVEGVIRRAIIKLRQPPNAPATIARKGSTNPLVNTGKLGNSVVHKVLTT